LDNKQFTYAKYVNEKLAEFSSVINEQTIANVLEPEKDNIKTLVTLMCTLHPTALQKG
jgi:hypothetical protein